MLIGPQENVSLRVYSVQEDFQEQLHEQNLTSTMACFEFVLVLRIQSGPYNNATSNDLYSAIAHGRKPSKHL